MANTTLTTTQRGYGSKHQAERRRWSPLVATGTVVCWRCGQLIRPDEPWDLGHDDHDRSLYRGPEHRGRCNRAAGARKANARRRAATWRPQPPPVTEITW
jgi:hypothetical protein